MKSFNEQTKDNFYHMIDIATHNKQLFTELKDNLISILYDVVDIDLYDDILDNLIECVIELNEDSHTLNKYHTLLETCSHRSFRIICKEFLNDMLIVSKIVPERIKRNKLKLIKR